MQLRCGRSRRTSRLSKSAGFQNAFWHAAGSIEGMRVQQVCAGGTRRSRLRHREAAREEVPRERRGWRTIFDRVSDGSTAPRHMQMREATVLATTRVTVKASTVTADSACRPAAG